MNAERKDVLRHKVLLLRQFDTSFDLFPGTSGLALSLPAVTSDTLQTKA